MWAFDAFLIAHILTGAVGLALFWVPMLARKGAADHRLWGRRFAWLMLATGTFATGMGVTSLIDPLGTHPAQSDPALVRALFGWLMIYLAVLTISLALHGLASIRNKRVHPANRDPRAILMQLVVIALAVNCAVQGLLVGQPLMIGISVVGIASGTTNLFFMLRRNPGRADYLKEHVKALVGAGISVYTAFLSVGVVRLLPHLAFEPMIWSVPLILGVSTIIWHHRSIDRTRAAPARRAGGLARAGSGGEQAPS